ncbi:maleylpyruvate isomerase family mycothiol-dependent enzyme [Nocardioides campestrisoli]|uniref:maleylpyruvate isomerase family mycothiol-dependent enzyme n=1 Tax=Nocardioides campestrisoli TaxID=2736757 RepID=UPI0015E6CC7D|nr:maleylpyruvate isomerase family mycothiol-dependent enzyme [Nocardioides campestrisoli]
MKVPQEDEEEVYAAATRNRLLAAEMFAGLTPEQWRTPSLCAGWTVREVAAHLVPPERGFSAWYLVKGLVSSRGDLDRMIDTTTRKAAQRPTEEIVRLLRERAHQRVSAPIVGALGPMSDTCLHLRDAARPLGLDVMPELPAWHLTLDFLVTKPARRVVPEARLAGLELETTDEPWSHGMGSRVAGPSEAIAMAMAGRSAALTDLEGEGVPVLAARLEFGR